MLRNFFLLMLRNFFRQKFYSIVNIIGLAAGMTVSIFILLFIADELSFDTMHSKADRIFRVVEKRLPCGFSFTDNNLYLSRLSVGKGIIYEHCKITKI
jgi:hypothetical protein